MLAVRREMTLGCGIDLVWVPGGEFTMGSAAGNEDERPPRRVVVDGFYMGRREVTNAQYERFRAMHRAYRPYACRGDDMPVVNVSWHESCAFCRWVSAKEKVVCRLPTEAEWELAARGTDGRAYPWGEEPPTPRAGRANYGEGASRRRWAADGHAFAAPVGSFPAGASVHGCLDMAGNVWEWCRDWYAPYEAIAGRPDVNPTGPSAGAEKVARGGSWYNDADCLRCTCRLDKKPTIRSDLIGFRVVVVLERE
jgi:formylglycine-generating enzyme required for sulfatase activity